MSSAESHPEVLEALRLLHERVGRIEALHQKALQLPQLPTSWNPFSGANKEELRRLDEMQARIDQLTRAGVLHDALYSNLLRLVNELQARAGLAPTPPLPYAPPPPHPQPNPYYPVQPPPGYPPPMPNAPSIPSIPNIPNIPQGYPAAPDEYVPAAIVQPAAAARLHALNAKYKRFIQEAEQLGKSGQR